MDGLGRSINTYLGTFQKFLTFITEKWVRSSTLPTVSADCLRIFRNIIPKLAGWRRTVDLEKCSQRSRRILEECDLRLTTTDVDQFLDSPIVATGKAHFDHASSGRILSMHALCEARDYLLILITLRTGPGQEPWKT